MFRFSLILGLFLPLLSLAEPPTTEASTKPTPLSSLTFVNVTLGFISWNETAHFTKGSQTDHGAATLFGNVVTAERETYYHPRLGYLLSGSLMSGSASVGGSQTIVTYNQANQPWYGIAVKGQVAYRLSKWIITSAGPLLLYRSLPLRADPGGATATSGSSFNLGVVANLRLRFTDKFELQEELGTLGLKYTIWSLGITYKINL